MPPFYVGLCHIRPDRQRAIGVMETFAKAVKQSGGLVRRVNNAGIRPLPTEMRGKSVGERHKFANIATIEFISNPVAAQSALKQVRGLEDCVRANLLRSDDILHKRPIRPTPADVEYAKIFKIYQETLHGIDSDELDKLLRDSQADDVSSKQEKKESTNIPKAGTS
jgi:ribosomal protein S6